MYTLKVVRSGKVKEPLPSYLSPLAVYQSVLKPLMSRLDREHFVVLHLNGKNSVVAKETISIGSLTQTIVTPREVFKGAVLNSSAAIILAHNHPSGNPKPSKEDKDITRQLHSASLIMGIKILDHIIVGDNSYHSMIENGEL